MKVRLEENTVGYITLLAGVLSPRNYAAVAVLTVYPLALFGLFGLVEKRSSF